MSVSFESVPWNACVHTQELSLYSHLKVLGNGVRTHNNSNGKIPSTEGSEEDRTCDTASCRTASPTHYQMIHSSPVKPVWWQPNLASRSWRRQQYVSPGLSWRRSLQIARGRGLFPWPVASLSSSSSSSACSSLLASVITDMCDICDILRALITTPGTLSWDWNACRDRVLTIWKSSANLEQASFRQGTW